MIVESAARQSCESNYGAEYGPGQTVCTPWVHPASPCFRVCSPHAEGGISPYFPQPDHHWGKHWEILGVPWTWPSMPLARIKAPDLRDDSQALLPAHLSNVQNPVSRLCAQKTLSQKLSRGFRECNCGFRAVNFMKFTFAELSPQSE